MKILIVGSGGREHALAWKVAQNSRVTDVYLAPGNGGTQTEKKLTNVLLDPLDFEELATFAEKNKIAFTLIGPEAPLVNGIVDFFQSRNLPCFGPSKEASQLEGSKAFSKDFLKRHKIPSAEYEVFTDSAKAKAFVTQAGTPIVIKADGLAAGKGVVVAQTEQEANSAIDDMLTAEKYGQAGRRVVIETFLKVKKQVSSQWSTGKIFYRWPPLKITRQEMRATKDQILVAWEHIRQHPCSMRKHIAG
jgi:phosphoribosylamine--glycine ligase